MGAYLTPLSVPGPAGLMASGAGIGLFHPIFVCSPRSCYMKCSKMSNTKKEGTFFFHFIFWYDPRAEYCPFSLIYITKLLDVIFFNSMTIYIPIIFILILILCELHLWFLKLDSFEKTLFLKIKHSFSEILWRYHIFRIE